MSTKKQRQEIVAAKTAEEKNRILKIMQEADIYTRTLDPLFESYLDIYEIYQTMFIEWKEKGFPATQRHTNKAGATNNSKHPLAQQVETWSEKKMKALGELGLTNKIKPKNVVTGRTTARHDDVMTKQPEVVDELAEHRKKWREKS